MMRTTLLWLSEQPRIFRFVRSNPLARKFAARFVAGETITTAVEAVRDLNRRKITATLDLLGESISREADAALEAISAGLPTVADKPMRCTSRPQ